ncbi:MAG: hypothetical protein DRZ82_00685 [Thermoprotei archaeon]|nr:MAG: hypothetical protein DRZ82_00685 [Thermoprotei archaeon]
MDVFEAIFNRRSIRHYLPKPVEEEKLLKILEACRWAPSARNLQPWELIVIKDKSTLRKLAKLAPYGEFIAEAPLAIAVITDPRSKWHVVDGSLLTQNLMLAAWALGLGTCWIGTMDRDKAKEILGIPKDKHLLTIIPVGYPAEVGKSHRKSLKDFVYLNRYGTPYFKE